MFVSQKGHTGTGGLFMPHSCGICWAIIAKNRGRLTSWVGGGGGGCGGGGGGGGAVFTRTTPPHT